MAGSDLGDARLNKRPVTLLDRLADKPTASIPHACNGWAGNAGRLPILAQEQIGWEDILMPHFDYTQQRVQGRPVDPDRDQYGKMPHCTPQMSD